MIKKKLLAALAVAASFAAMATGALAYYNSHTQVKRNSFSIVAGEHDIIKGEVVEEHFDPETAQHLAPTMSFAKDPRIRSGVDYEAYAFMKVEMPKISASMELTEDYEDLDALQYELSDGWVLVGDKEIGDGRDHIYLYLYGSDLTHATTVPAGGMTTPLFTSVTVPDFCRAESLDATLDVEGFLEQSAGVPLETAIADARAWAGINS